MEQGIILSKNSMVITTYELLQIYRRLVKSLNLRHKKEATWILQY